MMALAVIDPYEVRLPGLPACTGMDPNIFFPDPSEELEIAQARSICYQCPVREACLDRALRNGEKDGIWGGVYLRAGTPARKRLCCPSCESTDVGAFDNTLECFTCGFTWAGQIG